LMLLALGVIPKSLDFLLNVWLDQIAMYTISISTQVFSRRGHKMHTLWLHQCTLVTTLLFISMWQQNNWSRIWNFVKWDVVHGGNAFEFKGKFVNDIMEKLESS
jgi:hypothetical protein